ncbi:hypothetical protein M407DRAFT_25950 [Tulasnella calospora MUT 4182]|uniref:Heme peroxidase n=1 Tax=Tulasnella calospora MUT 4182 TaxID=1051891 RepID=A0A0C3KT98_9AGAM|nr:hypothetical protein M407DRAFT_25950 [Tulasnella calospora MUT 4182]
MSSTPSPLATGKTLGNVIADTAYSAVDSSLHAAADGVERISDAIRAPPEALSAEDEVDGVYHSSLARLIDSFRAQLKRGLPFELTRSNFLSIIDALLTSKLEGGLDDRLYLLEHALTFLSRYPPGTFTSKQLQDKVISLLWYDLAHPPPSLVGSKYQFRTADASGTSIWHPEMGKAGSPYARSVQTLHPLPANQLPSPELLFDTLLKREDKVDHPAGLSTFFFAFANLVIHSLFWTGVDTSDPLKPHGDPTQPINKVSSYLDLSPLYGSSEADLKRIRLNDGTGRIHPDTFLDHRVLLMPASTPALLVMFSRNHNYIVEKLLNINERGKWQNPPPQDPDKKQAQDNEIFGTARLINCGWFMSSIFGDYLASILGLVRDGNSWSLDPLSNFRAASHEIVERGSGNIVSVEFLALYHFHSSIGAGDAAWTEEVFEELLGTRDWDSITPTQFRIAVAKLAKDPTRPPNTPPTTWPIGKYNRVDGKFRDEDLAKILLDASEQSASAFKARGTPHVMRVVEILGIQQNREWGTCSLNEFRKFLGLKPYNTFDEWNPRKDIADAGRRLYRHPDNIELYVGLQAEQAKTVMDGAGLCPGFTMSRAILADAVALVRGDRFLTNDFTAYNLTAWGMQDCTRDPKNSANGGMMGKLLGRCLPDYFPVDSSYTNFPFVVPSQMKEFLKKVGTADQYTFTRPVPKKRVVPLIKYYDVKNALASPGLASTVPDNAKIVLEGKGYLASYDTAKVNEADRKLIAEAFVPNAVVLKKHVEFLERTTEMLLQKNCYTLVGDNKKSINIVRDVINLLPVYFTSEHVLGLPLKTPDHPHGSALDQEVYLKFKEIYEFIFVDIAEPCTKVAKEDTVKRHSQYFQDTVQAHIQGIASEQIPLIGLGASAIHWATQTPHESNKWLKRLLDAGKGKSKEELANDAMALAIAMSVELSQALTHVVDTFLGPAPGSTWTPNIDGTSLTDPSLTAHIQALAQNTSDKDATTKLAKIVVEALRTRPPVPGTYRSVVADVAQLSKGKGDRVYLSFTEAGVDPAVWGGGVKLTDSPPQALFAGELVKLLGPEWLLNAVVPVVKTIFKQLKDVKRAPGNSGQLLSFKEKIEGTPVTTYLDYKQEPTFWSSDLTVTFTS